MRKSWSSDSSMANQLTKRMKLAVLFDSGGVQSQNIIISFLKLWSSVCGILSERHEESKSAFDDDWYLCENKMKIWNFGSGNEFLASKSSIPAWSGFEDTNRCLQLIIWRIVLFYISINQPNRYAQFLPRGGVFYRMGGRMGRRWHVVPPNI